MSPVFPFDIIALIIDILVGEDYDSDTKFLKEIALVSFLPPICRKHLFAIVLLYDADPLCHVASSKKGFVKLLESRPDVVKYIQKLTYTIKFDHLQSPQFSLQFSPQFSSHLNLDNDDNLLSPILPNFLRTISCLNSLKIQASVLNWNESAEPFSNISSESV